MKTVVDGIEFRSKTEAAWYLVLQAFGTDPVYEPETYRICSAVNADEHCLYMPDFAADLQYAGFIRNELLNVRQRVAVEIKAGTDGESMDIGKACVLGYRVPTLIIVGWPLLYRAILITDRRRGCPDGFELVFRSGIDNRPCASICSHVWLGMSYPDEEWLTMHEDDLLRYFTPKWRPEYGTVEGDIARAAWNATKWNR